MSHRSNKKQMLMRKRHDARKKRKAQCARKIAFATLEEALAAAKQTGRGVYPYPCEFGKHFHNGHSQHAPHRPRQPRGSYQHK